MRSLIGIVVSAFRRTVKSTIDDGQTPDSAQSVNLPSSIVNAWCDYQANSAFRRNTRGFMYCCGDCHPGAFATNVGLNRSVTLLFIKLYMSTPAVRRCPPKRKIFFKERSH